MGFIVLSFEQARLILVVSLPSFVLLQNRNNEGWSFSSLIESNVFESPTVLFCYFVWIKRFVPRFAKVI
jgi:hypothetical protein